MFNKGEVYHEFQLFNSGRSSSCMKNTDDGAQEATVYKFGLARSIIFGSFSMSGAYANNHAACFHFVEDE